MFKRLCLISSLSSLSEQVRPGGYVTTVARAARRCACSFGRYSRQFARYHLRELALTRARDWSMFERAALAIVAFDFENRGDRWQSQRLDLMTALSLDRRGTLEVV